jgi:hypothetical protein
MSAKQSIAVRDGLDPDARRAYDLIRCALQPRRVEADCALKTLARLLCEARRSRDDYKSEAFRREAAMKAAWSALDRDDVLGAYDALDID